MPLNKVWGSIRLMNLWTIFMMIAIAIIGVGVSKVAYAEASTTIYEIDGTMKGYFPSTPKVVGEGELGSGIMIRVFSSVDDEASLVYTAAYQSSQPLYFNEGNVDEMLNNHVKGYAYGSDGKVISSHIFNHDKIGSRAIIFTTENKIQGEFLERRHGIAVYHLGKVYQWGVKGYPSISTKSAKMMFIQNLDHFSILQE